MISIHSRILKIKDKTGKDQRTMFEEVLKTMKKSDRFSWSSFQNIIRGNYIRSMVAKDAVYVWLDNQLEAIKKKEGK